MKKTQLSALFLSAALLLTMLSGCGSSADTDAASASETAAVQEVSVAETTAPEPAAPVESAVEPEEASAAEASVEEPVYEKHEVALPISENQDEISMFLLIPPFISAQVQSTTDLTVLGELETRTGLVFDITAGNYIDGSSEVNLLIASGNYPDIINHADLYTNGTEAAVEEGIILDLRDYILNDIPNLLASLKSYDEDVLKQMTTSNGYIGYFPQIHAEPYVDNFAIGLNKDVMEQLNLSVPATFDEFYDLLTTVHAETGLQYGLSSQGTDAALMCGLDLPAFGSTGGGIEGFRVVDGVVEMGALTEEMREYCEMIAKWFNEGLIYSDFLSYEDFQQTNMVAAGTLFGNGNVNAQTIGEAAASGVQVEAIPFLTRNAGDSINLKGSGEVVRSAAWSISGNASAESIDRICQLVDYIFSDEGTLLFNYGVEGEGFNYDDNGEPEWSDLVMNYDGGYTTAAVLYATATPSEYICGIYDDAKFNFSYTDAQIACQDIIDNSSTGDYDFPIGGDNVMTTEEKTEAASLSSDLSTYVSETALSWICGQSTLDDAAWETYLANCEAMNAQRLVEIYQDVYDRFMAE
jgi:putative aldouronate transport system substrate-binding protein